MLEPKDIKKVRKQLGVTQSKLANISGVSQSLIAKIEAEKIDPSYSKVRAISDALESLQRKSSKKASDIMIKDIVKVDSNDTVEDAVGLMNKYAISQIPVFESGRYVGGITEKTIVRLLSTARNPLEVFRKKAGAIMEEPFPTVGEETPVEALYSLLNYFQAVMVIKRDKVIGIITKADLIRLG